jgi:hypothetical protein
MRPDLVLIHYLRVEGREGSVDLDQRAFTPVHLFKRGIDIVRERELEFKLRWVDSVGVPVAMLEPRVPAVGPRRLDAGPGALAAAYEQAMR